MTGEGCSCISPIDVLGQTRDDARHDDQRDAVPTPCSVICSPIHMRNIVPTVSAMQTTAKLPNPASKNGWKSKAGSLSVDLVVDDHRLEEGERDRGERVHWLMRRWPAAPSLAIASSRGTTFTSRLKMMLALM